MDIQQMKKYLSAYRTLQREVHRQEVRLREAERMLRRPLYRMTGDGELETMVQARRRVLASLMEAAARDCRTIEDLIGRVEGRSADKTLLYRQLLGLHYVDGLTFAVIADQLHYHERHIRRLHREALEAAVEVYGKGVDSHDMA